MCFEFLYIFFPKKFFIPRIIQRDIIINVPRSSRKTAVIHADFKQTCILSTDFRKHIHISNFMKIRPIGVELLHTDGWADKRTERHDEANSRFSQCCESA